MADAAEILRLRADLARARAALQIHQVTLEAADIDAALQAVCAIICETIDLDRVTLSTCDLRAQTFDLVAEWVSPRASHLAAVPRGSRIGSMRPWVEYLLSTRTWAISKASAPHPAFAGASEELHAGRGIRSRLWYPFSFTANGFSFLSCSSALREHDWDEEDIALVRTAARMCSTLLERENRAILDEALRDNEARYRAIVEDQTEMIVRTTAAGVVTFVNEAFCRYFNVHREDMVGRAWDQEVPDQDRPLLAFRHASLTPDHPVTTCEHQVILRGGEVRWTQWTDRARFDPFGSLQDVQSVGRDITDQRRTELALRRSEAQFRTLVEQAPEAILILDLDFTLVDVNVRACSLSGYEREELLGRSFRDLLHEDDQARLDDELHEAIHGATLSGERRVLTRDGLELPTEFIAKLLPDGRLLLIIRDISERKRAERALLEAKLAAESAAETKGHFLANMSHELRTPLTGILGMSELLLDSPLDEVQQDFVHTVRSCGQNLLALINDVLDYSKLEAGKMELENIPCDLTEIAEEAMQLLAEQAQSKGVELVNAVSPHLPARVLADPGRLRQVLLNLIGNAIKFTEQGEVEVRVSQAQVTTRTRISLMGAPDSWVAVEIAIRDTGIGIEPGAYSRLFQAFSQADASTTRRFGGTGLGLVITKSLVELMGGSIHITSMPGKGSTFAFTLRLMRDGDRQCATLRQVGPRIALAIPNQSLRLALAGTLIGFGFRVDGEESVARLHLAEPPVLAILDAQLADAPPAEQIASIRARVGRSNLPVIVLTPLTQRLSIPGVCVLTKPVRIARLREALNTLLPQA